MISRRRILLARRYNLRYDDDNDDDNFSDKNNKNSMRDKGR